MITQNRKSRQPSKSFSLLFIGLLILGIAVAILIPLYLARNLVAGGMESGPAPATAQQFTLATPGSLVQIVFEVTSMPSSTLMIGDLLQKNSDGSYSRTGRALRVQWNPTGSVVMGSSQQVKLNTILQVNGRVGENSIVTANQIVILTNFVQVK